MLPGMIPSARRRTPGPSLGRTVVLLAVCLAATACGQSFEAKRQATLERAERLAGEGRLNEAIIEYQNALKLDDKLVPALHGLGRAYTQKYWVFDAVRELGRAHKLAEDSLPISVDYGRALVEIAAWDEADAQAARILARSPGDPQARYIQAGVLLGRGKTEQALAILDALPESAGLAELAAARAEALLTLGKTDQAEKAFRAAVAKEPSDARSFAGLGLIALRAERWGDAARYYDQAKVLREADPRSRLGLAAALARLGKVEQAITELEEVDPRATNTGVIAALGVYYLQANRAPAAIQLLAPVVTRMPRFAYGRFLLGSAYLAADRPTEALEQFTALEQQLGREPAVQLRLAMAESRLGRPRDALDRLEAVAKAFERTPEYHLERGRALALLGQLDQSYKAAETAQRLGPQLPQPYVLMGEIRSQQGNVKAAQSHFAKAAELNATYVPAYLALGQALVSGGQFDEALKAFEAAVRADPKSLAAVTTRAGALVQHGRLPDAIKDIEAAVAADPAAPGFNALLGSLYMTARQPDKAGPYFRRELQISPRNVDARMGLGAIALNARHEDEAIGHFREAVKVRPDLTSAVLLLTSLFDKQGRADLAVPIVVAAAEAAPRAIAFKLMLGDLYLKTGRYEEATERMTEVLKLAPGLAQARLVRAQSLLARGNAQAALKELTEVAQANPRSATTQYLLAHAYVALQRVPEAQAAYRETLRLAPQHEGARVELATLSGHAVSEAAQREQIDRLTAAIKADPRNVLLREALARAFLVRGDLARAQGELKQILDVAPLHMGANFLTARILMQQGKGQEAGAYLETVLRTNPSHVESNLLLARQLEARGQLRDAIAHVETALRADPTLAGAKYQLGTLYLQADRADDAAALVLDLERSAPKSPSTHVLRGRVAMEQGNPRAAIAAFSAALALQPDRADAHRGIGQAYEAVKQPDKAVEHYQRAIALNGADAVALNNLAWVLSETRKSPDEALVWAQKAAQIAPRSPEVLDTLGWIQYRRGAYAEAEKVLAQAVERAPGNASIHHHLGMTYYRLGKKTDALFTLRRASQLDPKLAQTENLAPLIKELGG